MPRRTRKQIVGNREAHAQLEREAQLRDLEAELHRIQELNAAWDGLKPANHSTAEGNKE